MTTDSANRKTILLVCVVAVTIGGVIIGCSTSAPRQTNFMQQTDIKISAEELRVRVRALAAPFSGILEQSADKYLEYTNDPEEIRAALLFKINGIPAMQRALFVQDPLAALLDAWVLLAQMRLHYENELETDPTHEGRRQASVAVGRMEDRLENLARSISPTGEIDHIKEIVYNVAKETPIDETFTTRSPTEAQLAKFTAEAKPGIGAAVGALTTSLGDVWARMDVYTAYLPKQARWQAELMVAELAGSRDPGMVFDSIDSITASIDSIAETVAEAPDLVSEEREAILRALQAERVIALKVFHDELTAAYEFISRERIAAISGSLATERKATLEALTQERIATLQAIHEERVAAMAELDGIVGGLSEDAMARLVDRLFVRILVLLTVLIIGAAIVAFIIARIVTRRRETNE